jgi:protein involved in polysaccharide export with SLBB domain
MMSKYQICAALTLLAFALFSAAGCRDTAVAPYPISEPPQAQDAAFGPGDLFDVRVFHEPDLTGTYQVGNDGSIAFPLIGRVVVANKLPSEVEAEIQSRLADGFLRAPQVSVLPKEYRSKKISVVGQVKQPGTFPYSEGMTVVEAVSKAGGFMPLARKNAVRITRKSNGKNFTVAVEDISNGKAPNFTLRPGDVIYVPERII